MKKFYAHFVVWIAYLTNNKYGGKCEDVHGRTYQSVYRKFGHCEMVKEYLSQNSWFVRLVRIEL